MTRQSHTTDVGRVGVAETGSHASRHAASGVDGPSGFDPARIIALEGDRYSPNLRKWLRKAARERPYRAMPALFQHRDGTRYVGWLDDDMWLIGSNLMRCLTVGSKAETWAYTFPPSELTEIVGFWARYETIGRCAIDEHHDKSCLGNETRWLNDGETRSCLWCGNHTQKLRRWTETVERERWEPSHD